MAPHLLLIYQVVVVGIGVAAGVVCIQRAARSGREDHAAFVVFWALFTASLIMRLARGYIVTNINDPSPQTLLVLEAISIDANLLIVATVASYFHRLGDVPAPRMRDALVLGGLLVSLVAVGVPGGIELDAAEARVSFRAGFWIGEGYYMLGLLYAAILAWVFVVRRPRGESPAFLIVLALFATVGLLESSRSLARLIANPTANLVGAPVVYSSLLYAVYGVFLIANGGIEESAGQARMVRFVPAAGAEEVAGEPLASENPLEPLKATIERLGLSERERDVVALVLEGRSNQEIADKLYVSLATVKTHLYRIYRKAEVPSRYGLIRVIGHSA